MRQTFWGQNSVGGTGSGQKAETARSVGRKGKIFDAWGTPGKKKPWHSLPQGAMWKGKLPTHIRNGPCFTRTTHGVEICTVHICHIYNKTVCFCELNLYVIGTWKTYIPYLFH